MRLSEVLKYRVKIAEYYFTSQVNVLYMEFPLKISMKKNYTVRHS